MRFKLIKNPVLLFIVFVFISSPVFSLDYEEFDWNKSRSLYTVDSADMNYSAIVMYDKRHMQIKLGYNSASAYYTVHKIIKVLDDAGIEKFNKVYIPLIHNGALVDIKVRSIKPNNESVYFNEKNLKELKKVDGFNNYKIFAVEGIEKGAEIEYIYTVKRSPSSYGREIYQTSVPVKKAIFSFNSPNRLDFEFKGYNGFPNKTVREDPVLYRVTDIPALQDEDASAYHVELMRIDYRLVSGISSEQNMTWKNISKNLLTNYVINGRGSNAAYKLGRSLGINDNKTSEIEKIVALEEYFKTNIRLKKGAVAEYRDPKYVLKDKIGNEEGLVKAFANCLRVLGIDFEVVYSGSRYSSHIDKDFPTYLGIRDMLFYFPKYNEYLSLTNSYMRLGAAPGQIAGNEGLFIKTYTDYNDRLGYKGAYLKTIEVPSVYYNSLGVTASIDFQKTNQNTKVDYQYFYQGYRAFQYRDLYSEKENDETFFKETILSDFDIENADFKVVNPAFSSSVNNDSLKLKATFETSSLTSYAGDDIILSIGKIIGKQNEMYDLQERQCDYVLFSKMNYHHEIIVNIPEGYIVEGLDALLISNEIEYGQDKVMSFNSGYSLDGNKLYIEVMEIYNTLKIAHENYSDYTKIVNSAADFNKVVLVLKPEN